MLENVNLLRPELSMDFWLAQIVNPTIDTAEEAALIFSGPRFFVALISGIVLAFGFQLLLTNLSVAAGISYLGNRSSSDTHSSSGSVGGSVKKVGTALGIWTLITVSLALFVACLLAVKLSLINSPLLGAIVGLVIWATFFSLMVWISSTTVGSLVGSVVNAATSGFQAILGTATNAIGAKVAHDQIVSTTEATVAAVRRELMTGIDPESLRENVEDYLAKLRPSELDVRSIRQEFDRLLRDPEFQAIADPDQLGKIDRQAFVDLVSSRTDLSKREVNRVVDELEAAWTDNMNRLRQSSNRSRDLIELLKTGKPGDILSETLNQQLDRFKPQSNDQTNPAQNLGMQFFNGLIGVVLGRTDLSDFDIEKILNQLKSTRDQVSQQADKLAAKVKGEPDSAGYSPVRADVENYLLNTYSWEMTPASVDRDFREVLYDPDADPTAVRRQISQLNRLDFVDFLKSRGVFTQEKINQLSFQLEGIRREVLAGVIAIEETEKEQDLLMQLDSYLRLAPRETLLNQDTLMSDLRPILEDSEVDAERLRDRFAKFNQTRLLRLLEPRTDLSFEERQQLVTQIQRIYEIVAADSTNVQQAAQARVSAQWQKLEDYLRHTGKTELNPEGIKRDLQTLLSDPQMGVQDLQLRLSRFDRDTLVQLLSQRPDLTEAEANHILDQVESNWYRVSHAPQLLAAKASEQYDKISSSLADYLRNTGREELNPNGIQRDLRMLLYDPKLATRAWRDRLSKIDRQTIVQLLSQRRDLSEAQANQIVDQVLSAIQETVRTPRRLAVRTQGRLLNFQSSLDNYLRNTGKEELNPEDIKRDLQILLHDPRLGMELMGDRLSQFDRSTLVALLAQRPDITETEANEIADRILSVRDTILQQTRAIQFQIQSVIDRLFATIRNYLNSLERPELNYDGIKQDIRTLFDDPQAGFEALRDRLSQIDRNTLVAVLSSREDMSKADAERIVDQVDRARTTVLRRAERVQQQVQQRLDEVKYQAQHQMEETRKAAATAAWWLFATALSSATLSAIAGGLAVAPR